MLANDVRVPANSGRRQPWHPRLWGGATLASATRAVTSAAMAEDPVSAQPDADATSTQGPGGGAADRVEQRFEEWGRRIARLLAGAAARAREEAEDMLAEAQSIRRGERE